MQSAKKLPQSHATLQAAFFMVPSPIAETPTTHPRYGYVLFLLDTTHGKVVGFDLLTPDPDMEAMLGKLLNTTLKLLMRYGSRPRRIQVSSKRLFEQLKSLHSQMKIRVTLHDWLPDIEMARASLEQYMLGGW
jgi:hypothetical protein